MRESVLLGRPRGSDRFLLKVFARGTRSYSGCLFSFSLSLSVRVAAIVCPSFGQRILMTPFAAGHPIKLSLLTHARLLPSDSSLGTLRYTHTHARAHARTHARTHTHTHTHTHTTQR